MTKAMRGFIIAILLMGIVRFTLDRLGVPKDTVKYFSMSAIIMAGLIYFSVVTVGHKARLKAAYLLILPYMIIEVLALGYTWASGNQTIFHTEEYSFGMSVRAHTIGHLVGGLTWEPLAVFVLMEIIWFVCSWFVPKRQPGV